MAARVENRSADADEQLRTLLERRDMLRERRAALVLARRAEQAEADALAMVMRAIIETRRSRDAGTSAAMERRRVVFEALMDDVERLAVTTTKIGRRVLDLELGEDDPITRRAQRAADTALRALQAVSDDLASAARIRELASGQG